MQLCDKKPKRERWRPMPMPGYEDRYQVSDWGRVRRLGSETVKKLSRNKKGYEHCTFHSGGRPQVCQVHRLVVAAFIRPFRKGEEVNHLNGIKHDNRLDNLEIVSHRENILHAYRTGLIDVAAKREYMLHAHKTGLIDQKGEKHPRAILTDEKVREIRQLYTGDGRSGGSGYVALARKFGVSRGAVQGIISRRRWKHLES
jgi:hypothetical protein